LEVGELLAEGVCEPVQEPGRVAMILAEGAGEDGQGHVADGFVDGLDVEEVAQVRIDGALDRHDEFDERGQAHGRGESGVAVADGVVARVALGEEGEADGTREAGVTGGAGGLDGG
jgi:hypothetical protein